MGKHIRVTLTRKKGTIVSAKRQLLIAIEASLITGHTGRRDFIRFISTAGLFSTGVTALADSLDSVCTTQIERSKSRPACAGCSG